MKDALHKAPDFLIHRALFEVDIHGISHVTSPELALSGVLREKVMPRLESVLRRCFDSGASAVISKLDVAVEEVGWDELESRLPELFERAMEKALKGQVFPKGEERPSHASSNDGGIEPMLTRLLLAGRGGETAFDLLDAWVSHRHKITAFLKAHAGHRTLPLHAATHLNRDQLRLSAMWISPTLGPFASEFIFLTVSRHTLLLNTAPVAGQADAFESQLWTFTLAWLLGQEGTASGRRGYLAHVIHRMAARDNMKSEKLRAALVEIFGRSHHKRGREITELLLSMAPCSHGDTQKGTDFHGEDALERLLMGHEKPGDWDELIQGMTQFGAREGHRIRLLAKRGDVRARMVKRFSHGQLVRLVSLVGDDGEVVGGFVRESVARSSAVRLSSPVPLGGKAVAPLIWELSLALLFAEKESAFNFKTYVSCLIAAMAARWNMAYDDLLALFWQMFQDSGRCIGGEVVMGLYRDGKTREKLQNHDLEADGDMGLEGALAIILSGRGNISESRRLLKELDHLKQTSSVGLRLWVRTLQRDPVRLRSLILGLSPEVLAVFLTKVMGCVSGVVSDQMAQVIAWVAACGKGEHGGFGSLQLELCMAMVQADHARFAELLATTTTSGSSPSLEKGISLDLVMQELRRSGQIGWALILERLIGKNKGGSEAEGLLFLFRKSQVGDDALVDVLARAMLIQESPWHPEEAQMMRWWVRRLLGSGRFSFQAWRDALLSNPWGTQRLAGVCDDDTARALVRLLIPNASEKIIPYVDVVLLGIESLGPSTSLWRLKTKLWAWIFEHGVSLVDSGSFLSELTHWMLVLHGKGGLGELLLGISAGVGEEPDGVVASVLASVHGALHGEDSPPLEEKSSPMAFDAGALTEEETAAEEVCVVDDAGLVILSPYLPSLFERLGYLEGGRWRDESASARAQGVCRYLSHKTEAPLGHHPLARVLCGVEMSGNPAPNLTLTEGEMTMADGLLTAVLQHWKPMKNTSIEGLRESFIARGGMMHLKEGAWHLTVEPQAYDMLLDQLPWGISPIRHPFMTSVLHVTWR